MLPVALVALLARAALPPEQAEYVLLVDMRKHAVRHGAADVLEEAAAVPGLSLDALLVLGLLIRAAPLELLPSPLVAREARFEPQPLLLVLRAKVPRGLELTLLPARRPPKQGALSREDGVPEKPLHVQHALLCDLAVDAGQPLVDRSYRGLQSGVRFLPHGRLWLVKSSPVYTPHAISKATGVF